MYGYLRDLTLHKSPADPVAYRGYYCGMCCAIARVLGAGKVFINNRDIVSFAILMKLNRGQENITAKGCYVFTKKGKSQYTNDWKKMVMLAVAILYSKALDDRRDGDEKKAAKVLKKIAEPLAKFNEMIPNFTAQIDEIMDEFFEREKRANGVLEQGEAFADSVVKMELMLFDVEEQIMIDRLRALMVWYCLIDAIDDYKKDYKSGGDNPLFAIAKKPSLNDFNEDEKGQLKAIVDDVKARLLSLMPNPCEDKEDVMIAYYLDTWCPQSLDKLLKNIL